MDKLEKFLYDNSLNAYYGKMGYTDADEAKKKEDLKSMLNTKYGKLIMEVYNNDNK